MRRILLITDYRNSFYSKMGSQEDSFDIKKLKTYFTRFGYNIEILQFADIDFLKENYQGVVVLYTSLEDPGLLYKGYIEDIVFGLHMAGAYLIPQFYFLKAHENKVFLEIARKLLGTKDMNNLDSRGFGVPSEMDHRISEITCPVVIKSASGAASMGVRLAESSANIIKLINSFLKVPRPIPERIKSAVRPLTRWCKKQINPRIKFSNMEIYYEKFITQQFIQNLTCDYKVLVYNDKYYVLQRGNRKNDFRASGSGIFSWPTDPPKGLLDYAHAIFVHLDVPFLSLDIAYNNQKYFLIEFQAIMFGTYTLEASKFYFKKGGEAWNRISGESEIEEEFVKSIIAFLERKKLSIYKKS